VEARERREVRPVVLLREPGRPRRHRDEAERDGDENASRAVKRGGQQPRQAGHDREDEEEVDEPADGDDDRDRRAAPKGRAIDGPLERPHERQGGEREERVGPKLPAVALELPSERDD
jgi:hypothetical protein